MASDKNIIINYILFCHDDTLNDEVIFQMKLEVGR